MTGPQEPRGADARRIRLIGVPTDAGASRRGACMGPAALRVAGLPERLTELGYDVEDAGDVVEATGRPINPCNDGAADTFWPLDGSWHEPQLP